jgi:putative PIG3 family NAD(P)H quinone oxidoreductase
MRVVEIVQPGGPEVLRIADRPTPDPGPGDVLVRVGGAGVNRPDLFQRQGKYPPPPGASDIPGLEIAGTVERLGSDTTRWCVGDRICALVAGGGYAEYGVVPAPQCLPIPSGLDEVTAAAIPETYFTVWTNVFQRGRLTAGERLLVHGGTSGIGTTAIQLARQFDATVYATAGSDDKAAACERLGAERGINYRTTDFVAAIKDLTAGRGVDVILDIVGGDYLPRNLECLAMDGRLVQIGLMGGVAKSQINLALVMQRRVTLTGSLLRVRSVDEKGAIARDLEAKVWPLLSSGRVKPVVDRVLPLDQAAMAHRLLESGEIIGKIVLAV